MDLNCVRSNGKTYEKDTRVSQKKTTFLLLENLTRERFFRKKENLFRTHTCRLSLNPQLQLQLQLQVAGVSKKKKADDEVNGRMSSNRTGKQFCTRSKMNSSKTNNSRRVCLFLAVASNDWYLYPSATFVVVTCLPTWLPARQCLPVPGDSSCVPNNSSLSISGSDKTTTQQLPPEQVRLRISAVAAAT